MPSNIIFAFTRAFLKVRLRLLLSRYAESFCRVRREALKGKMVENKVVPLLN
jgi:hypothetical protein